MQHRMRIPLERTRDSNGPIIVEMIARVRQNDESPLMNSVIRNLSLASAPLSANHEKKGIGHLGPTLYRNVQRFRGGLVCKAHRLCVSLNSRLESNTEEKKSGSSLDNISNVSHR